MSNSKLEPITPEVQMKYVSPSETSKKEPQNKRLVHPKRAELGSQIVGSRHTYFVELPKCSDAASGDAHASAMLKPSPAMTSEQAFVPAYTLKPHDVPHQFAVDYAPTERGEYNGAINFVASWNDEHVEEISVPIHASARELDDVQNASVETPSVATLDPHIPKVKAADPKTPVTLELKAADDQLSAALDGLFQSQVAAINIVKGQAGKFTRKPAELPFWVDLVQIALEVGLSVVSERLGALVGEGIAHRLGHAFAEEHEGLMHSIEKVVDSGFENSVKKSKLLEVEPPEKKDVDGVEGGGANEGPVRDTSSVDLPISTDPVDSFFDAQSSTLLTNASHLKLELSGALSNAVATLGADAPEVMSSIASIEATSTDKQSVKSAQVDASTAQWLKYLARAELGTESERGKETTSMDAVRRSSTSLRSSTASSDGLLEINAADTENGYEIVSARVTGIAWSMSDRLLCMDLRKAQIPIAIRIRAATVTVDEAGRIRSDGPVKAGHDGIPWTEVQGARDAQELVDSVLSKTLQAHHVKEIKNDDANPRPKNARKE